MKNNNGIEFVALTMYLYLAPHMPSTKLTETIEPSYIRFTDRSEGLAPGFLFEDLFFQEISHPEIKQIPGRTPPKTDLKFFLANITGALLCLVIS